MLMLLIALAASIVVGGIAGAAIGGVFGESLRGLWMGAVAGFVSAAAWLVWLMRSWRGGV